MTEPQQQDLVERRYPHVFRPIRVGTMRPRPPAGGAAARWRRRAACSGATTTSNSTAAYWLAKVDRRDAAGSAAGPTFVRNPLPPGFEPTGVGAHGPGFFRHPRLRRPASASWPTACTPPAACCPCRWCCRAACRWRRRHAVELRRPPHPPCPRPRRGRVAGPRVRRVGRARRRRRRRRHRDPRQPRRRGAVVPLAAHQPPRPTSTAAIAEQRRRFLREVVESIRDHASRPITLGLRLCLDEMIDGGYGVDECAATVAAFTADGTVDYFSLDVGNNWGDAELHPARLVRRAAVGAAVRAGQGGDPPPRRVRRAGRSTSARPRRCWPAGHADLVAMARATMADPDTRGQDPSRRRGRGPSLHRAERVHPPQAGRGAAPTRAASTPGSPARPSRNRRPRPRPARCWSSAAARPAPSSPRCAPSEATTSSCGSATTTSAASSPSPPRPGPTAATRTGSTTRPGDWTRPASASCSGGRPPPDDVLAAGVDVVAVATGGSPRLPDVPGVELPHVVTIADVLGGHRRRSGRTSS